MQHRESHDSELDAYAAMLAWILHGLSARRDQPLLAYFVGMSLEAAIEGRDRLSKRPTTDRP